MPMTTDQDRIVEEWLSRATVSRIDILPHADKVICHVWGHDPLDLLCVGTIYPNGRWMLRSLSPAERHAILKEEDYDEDG